MTVSALLRSKSRASTLFPEREINTYQTGAADSHHPRLHSGRSVDQCSSPPMSPLSLVDVVVLPVVGLLVMLTALYTF